MHIKPLKYIKRVIPILEWLPKYNTQTAICDAIAGITVGLTLIPQSMAYALLAGLGPQYGLYASLVGGFIYAIFGTVKDLNIAPTALCSLLTLSYIHHVSYGSIEASILLCFLCGLVQIVCGIFHLGFLVDFVSMPVVGGFTTAASLTIIISQIKGLLGLHFKAETFAKIIYQLYLHYPETKFTDLYLGIGCCIFLITLCELKRFGKAPTFDKPNSENIPWYKTTIWYIALSRNAFVVIFCAFLAYFLKRHDMTPFSLTSPVPQGLPRLRLPFVVTDGNTTISFVEATKELGTGIIVVPLVAILTNVALAKTFSNGKVVRASQEMLALGLCNLSGSFLGAYPTMASFSRAAVNNASGAKTTFGGIYTGIIVMLALTFLTPYFSYIPKSTLSSVIICALIYMIEYTLSILIWKINKIDFFPLIITLIACLALSIEIGIVIGILVDLLLILYYTARPKVEIDMIKHGNIMYIKVFLVGSYIYSAAEYTRSRILKMYMEFGGFNAYKYIVIDCRKLQKTDFTAGKCMDSLVKDLILKGTTVIFYGTKTQVNRVFKECVTKDVHFIDEQIDINNYIEDLELTNVNGIHKNGNSNIAYVLTEEHELSEIPK